MRTVGLVGLGHMGVSISRRLLAAGYPLLVYNRTKEKAGSLMQLGAQWSESPRQLAESVDVLISMVSSDEAVDAIAKGEDGFLAGLSTSNILLEMSTLSPNKVVEIFQATREKQAAMLHAPILGGPVDVYNSTATICVGGAKATYKSIHQIIEDISPTVHYVGELTNATLMKFALNIMLTHFFLGLSSSLNFAREARLPAYLIHDIITGIAQPVMQKMGEKLLNDEQGITFSVKNFAKDQRYFLEAAKSLDVSLPTIEAAHKLAEDALAKGMADEDFTRIHELLKPKK